MNKLIPSLFLIQPIGLTKKDVHFSSKACGREEGCDIILFFPSSFCASYLCVFFIILISQHTSKELATMPKAGNRYFYNCYKKTILLFPSSVSQPPYKLKFHIQRSYFEVHFYISLFLSLVRHVESLCRLTLLTIVTRIESKNISLMEYAIVLFIFLAIQSV